VSSLYDCWGNHGKKNETGAPDKEIKSCFSVDQVFFGQAGVTGFADDDMVEQGDVDGFTGGFNRGGQGDVFL